MSRSNQVVLTVGFICACSAASGQSVELVNVDWDAGGLALCRFKESPPYGPTVYPEDDIPLEQFVRSADELNDSPLTCDSEIDWSATDLLIVEISNTCSQFEELGAEIDEGTLVVSINRHQPCCGIEMWGTFRVIYLVAEGTAQARLDYSETSERCGLVP